MKIALIPGSFKPYHAGHDALIRKAAAENDRVIVFYSSGDRSRPGELPVSGEVSTRIMKEYVSYSLPENVKLVESKIPVRSVFELLAEVDNMSNDSYSIYSDSDDIARYRTVSKYAPKLSSLGRIYLKEMTRGEDSPKVSGTSMRNYAAAGDLASFRAGLPIQLRESAPEIFKLLGGASRRPLVTTESISNHRSTVAHSSKNDIDRSTELMIKTLLEISGSRRPVNRVTRQSRNMKILEELMHSESLLLEFEGDGPSGYDSFTTSPNIFVKTFIAPFANVLNATKGLALDVANVAKLVGGTIIEKIKGNPNAFGESMTKYRRSHKLIKNKYWGPVKKYNNEALSGDAQLLAFGLAPHAYVAANMLTTFKRVIAGKADQADTGLIGALAASKLLPANLTKSWEDFKNDAKNARDIDDITYAEKKASERADALNVLKRKVPLLIASLLALKLADKDQKYLKELKGNLEKNGMDVLKGSDIDKLRRMAANQDDREKIDQEIDIINDAHSRRSRNLSASRMRDIFNNDLENDIEEKSKAIKSISGGSKKLIAQSFVTLRAALNTYKKNVLFARALFSSKDFNDMNTKLRYDNLSFDEEIRKLQEDIKNKIAQANNKKTPSDQEVFKYAKSAIITSAAKSIYERQKEVMDTINQIKNDVMPAESNASINNESFRSLKQSIGKVITVMNKIAVEINSEDISESTKQLQSVIDEINEKIENILSKKVS